MRFFRIARILNIPDILQFLHILRSSNSIRLTRMLCLLFSVWLSAAGFVHLVIFLLTRKKKQKFLYEYIGRKFGRFFSQLFKFTTNYVFSMCLFSYRHNEVRQYIKDQDSLTFKSVWIYTKKKLFCFLILSYA
jgi:hypothetical protein